MVADARAAAHAYKQMASLAEQLGSSKSHAAAGADDPFGGMVGDAVSSLTQQAKAVDQQSAALVTGRADLVDVVTAVAEAESSIETLVAVRDKVIAAYEEIMRMPI